MPSLFMKKFGKQGVVMPMEIFNGKYCVYVHINNADGKKYVGQTCKKPEHRWNNGKGYRYNKHFWNAIQKYGWENFEHEIIASNLTLAEANNFEELLIKELDTLNPKKGYNLVAGGENHSVSDITRERQRESRKKNGGASYARDVNGVKNPRAVKVAQYTKDGCLVKIWDTMTEASKALNLRMSNISRCCQHLYGYKTAGGFVWEYAK